MLKTTPKKFRIITYGRAFWDAPAPERREAVRGVSVCRRWNPPKGRETGEYLLISFDELDQAFAEAFRERATRTTRLIVFLNKGLSADRLVSRMVDLRIRTAQRFYVMEASFGSGKVDGLDLVETMLKRLTSALEANEGRERILDAKVEDGVLHVVNPAFDRLDVPLASIPGFGSADPSMLQEFEIDQDGSFIYWPKLDAHLGWTQLRQLIDPRAALKASQKSREFNRRHGEAALRLRKQAGLKPNGIAGLSGKQLQRIEKGECRLTSNAIEALSQAHHLAPNEYLRKLAEDLE